MPGRTPGILALPISLALLAFSAASHAVLMTCEPDDYAAGTDMTSVCSGVTLSVDIGSNPVTSSASTSFASTGDQVFRSPRDIDWLTGSEELRATFGSLMARVSIDLVSDGTSDPGFLRAWTAGGTLLAEVLATAGAGSFVTATISRPSADIAYVTAGSSGTGIEDLHLDNLRYDATAAIPEPSLLALFGLGLAILCFRWQRIVA